MKYFSLSFLFILFDGIPIDVQILEPTFNVYAELEPVQIFQENFLLDLTITPSRFTEVKEVLKVGHTEDDFYFIDNPNYVKSVKSSYTLQYTIPSRLYFDENGCYVSLSFYSANGSLYEERGWWIKPVTPSSDIYPENYVNEPYTANNISTIVRMFGYSSISESFQFPDYIDYFNIDVYHRLDLDSITFKYSSLKPFVYDSAYLTYHDFDNVFPYVDHNAKHQISIPLTISMDGTNAMFSYRDVMWVNPTTLQMSLVERRGFVRTRHFYMPVNKKEQLLEDRMQITVKGAGWSKNDIHYDLSYLASRDLIGDCDNSDYCIVEVEP